MKSKNFGLVAALTLSVFTLATSGAYAEVINATEEMNNDIEIKAVKCESDLILNENMLDENVIQVKGPFPKAVSPRIKNETKDCETGAAIPPPCDCDMDEDEELAPSNNPCEEESISPPCKEEKPTPCDVSPACPISKATSPCPVKACDMDKGPDCAVCPSIDKDHLSKVQVYAYPKSTMFDMDKTGYGTMFDRGSYGNMSATAAMIIKDNSCGCQKTAQTYGYLPQSNVVTGAAAGVGVQMSNTNGHSIPVDNSPQAEANHGCPITVHSNSSIQVSTKELEKLDVQQVTGAATPLINTFDDVHSSFWAADEINRLAASKVIAGYPDQTFRPNRNVTRAEFASLVVSGLNYEGEKYYNKALFADVPEKYWANKAIDKGMNAGLLAGYPNGLFKPNNHVTRTEALVILSKALPSCDIDECKADTILSKYHDGDSVPQWAKVSVAKALQADVLKKSPDTDRIRGNDLATRAEIAGMLANMRIAMGIDPAEIACGCTETGAAAYVEVEKMQQYPTLKVKFDDSISAKDNQAGDGFRAYTTECISINGTTFPEGSIVRGKIVEVLRPSGKDKGGLKIAFTEIQNGDDRADLPQEVLAAQVIEQRTPNIASKIAKSPFTWLGALAGNTCRTAGAIMINAGNGLEAATNDIGTGTGELFQGKVKASLRSYGQSGLALLKTPVDMVGSAASGIAGTFELSVDEVAYIMSSDGSRISQINPREVVQVAFGTCDKK